MSEHAEVEEREAAVADALVSLVGAIDRNDLAALQHVLRALYITAYTAGVNDMAERAQVVTKSAFEGRSA
jgi:hypothetical protein